MRHSPSPDSDAAAIKLRILGEKLIQCGELVFQFDPAKLVTYGSHELAVARRCAAIVDGEDCESSLRQQLMKESRGTNPILDPHISDQLCGWPSVDIHNQRNLAGRWALPGEHEFPVENGSIISFELEKLRLSQSVIVHAARVPYSFAASINTADGNARGRHEGGEFVDVVFAVVGVGGFLVPLYLGNSFAPSAFQFCD